MTDIEYYFKDRHPDMYPLSDNEVASGWHFCADWNYRLVGPGMDERFGCTCDIVIREDSND